MHHQTRTIYNTDALIGAKQYVLVHRGLVALVSTQFSNSHNQIHGKASGLSNNVILVLITLNNKPQWDVAGSY